MKKKRFIPFTLLSVSALALGAGSLAMASFIMNGRRQTIGEAWQWQKEHYDVSWYETLEKTAYTVSSYDGYVLHTLLCKAPVPSDRYVILTHGYSDNHFGCLKYMKMYLDAGFNCIIYDLRGHGENEKTWCSYTIREAQDLYALIQDTRRRYDLPEDTYSIGLHGESLGASTSAAVLQYDQNLAFVVADCGFSEITNVLRCGMKASHLPGFLVHFASIAARLRYGYFYSQMRPVDALKGNHVPILFIHGAEDTFIRPTNSMDMQQATAGYSALHLIPDATHADSVLRHPDLYKKYLHDFLSALQEEKAETV